jgi:voltage-gated potassium channel Kch
MVITPYLMKYSPNIAAFADRFAGKIPEKRRKVFNRKLAELEKIPRELENHVVILGGGETGFGIAKAIEKTQQMIIIDQDSEVARYCLNNGMNAICGESNAEDVLEKANLPKAKLAVVAIPDARIALEFVDYARSVNKKLVIFARAHYFKDALALYERGVDFVSMPHIIGSNLFLTNVVKFLETGKLGQIAKFQDEYIRFLREKVKEEKKHFGF